MLQEAAENVGSSPSRWVELNPESTEGRREDRGRESEGATGGDGLGSIGLHWGRWEVSGRSSVTAQGPYGRLRECDCAGWRENTQ